VCPHTKMKCPNYGGGHPVQDARCQAKCTAIEIVRGRCASTLHPAVSCGIGQPTRLRGMHVETSPDWTEDPMEVMVTGTEPSGTAPPIAV